MSPPELEPKAELTCSECGARNEPGATECWLCQRRDWEGAGAPAKAGNPRGVDLPRRRNAMVFGAIAILSLGMLLDLWARWNLLVPVLVFVLLVIPLGLTLWARGRRQPPSARSMTRLDLAASSSTIAAGVILVIWLVGSAGFENVSFLAAILAVLAIPAGLFTWTRARRRRWEGRPMTVLQVTASMIFLTVLLPTLLLLSLVIALWLVCVAAGYTGPNIH